MDFRLGERSDEFRAEVAAFLDEHLTDEVIERVHATGTVHDWAFYRALAERGWLAAGWPEEYGGQGRDPFEMAAFAQEAARRHAPMDGLSTTMMVARTLLYVGTEEQKRAIVPRAVRGEILICLGYSEPDAGSDVAATKTRAARDGNEWVITGQKMFTTLAHESDYVFLLTRTNPDLPKHQGLTMFLVPLDSPGIEIHPVHTLGGERTNITFYNEVRVPDTARVGDIDGGWKAMTVALTFERSGGGGSETRRVLDQCVEWARTARQADGRRMLDDPVVRERLARVATDCEVGRLLGLRTAWIAHQGGLPGVEGSMAKLFASETFQRACSDLLDLLGPEGLRHHGEPDAPAGGWIEHAYRHAAVGTI